MEYNSVFDAVSAAVAKFGVKPKFVGKWIRIPAVWRGGDDFNISINPITGWTRDFVSEERFGFRVLMDSDHLGIPEARIAGTIKKTTRLAIKQQNDQSLIDVNNRWERAISINDKENDFSKICRKYLNDRGITDNVIQTLGGTVRVSPSIHGGAILLTPIICIKTNKKTGLQRLFLDKNGEKSNGSDSRRMMGMHLSGEIAGGFFIGSGGHRLNRTLLICEGFETGLALHSATGQTVMVTYNAGGMERIDIQTLSQLGYSDIVICGDNDKPDKFGVQRGQKAAWVLAARFYDEFNRKTRIALPQRLITDQDKKSVDWNDVYKRDKIGCRKNIQNSIITYEPANDKYKLEQEPLPVVRTRPAMKISA